MNGKPKKHRLALTLLMAALFFVLQTVAVLLAVGVLLILAHTGLIHSAQNEPVSVADIAFFMALISVIAGAILAMTLSKFYMQPVNRFVDQLNRLASGDFSARIHFRKPIAAHPTFQEIEKGFNTAAAELEQTEMLRADFINNFSHEFKTPIVSIAGFAKLLRRGELTEAQREEYLTAIEEESLRLAHMATSVLDLTKVENQTILTDTVSFNLSEQLRSAMLLLEDKWTKKELELELQLGEYEIVANEELLWHVWVNLLDNAVKFSPQGGCVEVCVEEGSGELRVAVSNAGTPIPAESLGRIFRKFYQADESHSDEGSGIGLAIVNQVVRLHRGRVDVESTAEKTTFTVTLPKR